MTEAKYSVNIIKSRRKICLILDYNATNSFLYAYGVNIYQFKVYHSEIKPYLFCLRNILNDFTVDNTKNGLNGKLDSFSVTRPLIPEFL